MWQRAPARRCPRRRGSGDWFFDYVTTNVTSHQSGHWGYGGWDDYGFTVSDVGSSTEDGDVGFYSSQESWSGSYTYQGNGGYSRTETYPGGTYTYPGRYSYVVPGTTISGSSSYTFLGHWTYSGSAEYDQAYDEPGETYVSSYDYDHVTDGSTTGHSEGSSSYSGPGGSSSMSYVGDSTGSTHDECHTTTLSGSSGTLGSAGYVSGWVSDHSEVHCASSSSSWTQTSTVNGTSSTTSGSYSSSTSTPSSSHTETGTVPSGPPAPPTYSGPDEADFDTLLTALAADAAGAYTSPTTRAAATDAAIASFTAVDDDGSGTTGGVIYTALSEAPEGATGTPPAAPGRTSPARGEISNNVPKGYFARTSGPVGLKGKMQGKYGVPSVTVREVRDIDNITGVPQAKHGTFTGLPPGHLVGTSGAGPCIGLIIVSPPDEEGNRTIHVFHFDARDNPEATLNRMLKAIPADSHAVVFGGQNNDPVSMGTLQGVMAFFERNKARITMDGIYNSPGLWVDRDGKYHVHGSERRTAERDGTLPKRDDSPRR